METKPLPVLSNVGWQKIIRKYTQKAPDVASFSLLETLLAIFPELLRTQPFQDRPMLFNLCCTSTRLYYSVWVHGITSFRFKPGASEASIQRFLKRNPRNLRSVDLACAHLGFGRYPYYEQLSQLKQITTLNLAGRSTTDEGVSYLASLQNLTSLDLGDCQAVTNQGLSILKGLKKLKHIGISSYGITDAGLKHLQSLKNLTSLNLRFCYRITDQGIAHLVPLSQLAYLDLILCHLITDGALKYLAQLPKLTFLNLLYCENVSPDCLSDFRKKMTQLRRLVNPYPPHE